MEDHNNNPTTALPDDNKKPTPRSIFNDIIEAAQIYWCPLDPIPAAYRRMGHMIAWGERSLRVDLSYRPKGEQIRLQVILADQVRENSETFQDLLWRANAAYSNAKVIFDRNLRVVIAQSNGDHPMHKDETTRIVRSVYRDFNCLINDECLRSALAIGKAHIIGTPVNAWDRE